VDAFRKADAAPPSTFVGATSRSRFLKLTIARAKPPVLSWPRVKTREDIRAQIRKFRGSLKRKPGDKPFAQEWAQYKAQEKALEEAKWKRFKEWTRRKRGAAKTGKLSRRKGRR
jgi:hypothetical protein